MTTWLIGFAVSGALGATAYALRTLDLRGVVTAAYGGFGIGGFGLLALFFVIGSGASKWGRRVKAAQGVAQSNRGRRTVRHVLANGFVPAICAVGATVFPEHHPMLAAGFAGSLAAATSDTFSSEVGQVVGGTPRLIVSWKPVSIGENGGVTVAGLTAGVIAACAIGIAGSWFGVAGIWWGVAVAGVVGNLADSVFGATLERRGVLNNAGVNLLCAATGGVAAATICAAFPASG